MTDHEQKLGVKVKFKEIASNQGYFVGTDGSVFTTWMRVGVKGIKRGYQFIPYACWHKMKFGTIASGYKRVTLGNGNKRQIFVHRLVLETFIGPCPDGCEGAHNDGNPANNNVKNLRWATPSENQKDRLVHGTDPRGENSHWAKLTEIEVRSIRLDYESGIKNKAELGRRYKVTPSCIYLIISRKSWPHVK